MSRSSPSWGAPSDSGSGSGTDASAGFTGNAGTSTVVALLGLALSLASNAAASAFAPADCPNPCTVLGRFDPEPFLLTAIVDGIAGDFARPLSVMRGTGALPVPLAFAKTPFGGVCGDGGIPAARSIEAIVAAN